MRESCKVQEGLNLEEFFRLWRGGDDDDEEFVELGGANSLREGKGEGDTAREESGFAYLAKHIPPRAVAQLCRPVLSGGISLSVI